MKFIKFYWTGYKYNLHVKRHWNYFFNLVCFFEIKKLRMTKVLESGQDFHVQINYEYCQSYIEKFDSFSNWHSFSQLLCDQFCEYYIMGNFESTNTYIKVWKKYSFPTDENAIKLFAEDSNDYTGINT